MKKRWIFLAGLAVVSVLGYLILKQPSVSPQSDKNSVLNMVKQKGVSAEHKFPPIENWVTANGAKVYFVRSPSLPMIDIQLVFDAGSARNGDKGGLSLLTNALLSDGTQNMDAQTIHERFEEVGAEFEADAQRDMAYVKIRSLSAPKYLDQAIATLAEVLTIPTFPQEALDRERNNALIALQNDAQNPSKIASNKFYQLTFDAQPYANVILGDEQSLKDLTQSDLATFHQQYYVARNAVIAMVGDVTVDQARAIAERLTERMPAGNTPSEFPQVPDLAVSHLEKISFPSEQTHIMVGGPGIKRIDQDYFPLVVGNHILGANGTVNRIFQSIRNKEGLAYDARSYFVPMRERGPFILGLQTKRESADQALNLLNNVLAKFVEEGPTEDELNMAKQNLLGGYALRFDTNEAICANLATIGFYGLALNYFDQYPIEVENVSVDQIKTAFKKRVHPDKLVTVLVGQTKT
ncbi:MAG: pitrilysin family protein [Gammaproteobacteria bacterium]